MGIDEKVNIELTSLFLAQTRVASMGLCPLIAYLGFVYYGIAPLPVLISWLGALFLLESYIFYVVICFKPEIFPQKISSTLSRLALAHLLLGGVLGSASLLFLSAQDPIPVDYLLVACLAGVVALSACTLSTSMRCLVAFVGSIGISLLLTILSDPVKFKWWFAILFALIFTTLYFSWVVHQSTVGLIKARLLNVATATKLEVLNKQMVEVNQSLLEKNQALHSAQRELEQHALHDELTGLYNRRYILALLQEDFSLAHQRGMQSCVALLDFDLFKQVNDQFGHAAGDSVLRSCANVLKKNLRQGEVLARLGGEEFLVYMPRLQLNEARILAERLRLNVANIPFHFQKHTLQVTISIGIAAYVSHDTPEMLIGRADRALYQAKNNGRNRIEVQEVAFD